MKSAFRFDTCSGEKWEAWNQISGEMLSIRQGTARRCSVRARRVQDRRVSLLPQCGNLCRSRPQFEFLRAIIHEVRTLTNRLLKVFSRVHSHKSMKQRFWETTLKPIGTEFFNLLFPQSEDVIICVGYRLPTIREEHLRNITSNDDLCSNPVEKSNDL